jgi:hypothetical protein
VLIAIAVLPAPPLPFASAAIARRAIDADESPPRALHFPASRLGRAPPLS